jgi:PAS domain S-box-containing protein
MVAGVVLLIIATTALTGVPGYLLIRGELQEQAWSRVEDGLLSSLALLASEEARLSDMALLAAQRPSLVTLVDRGDWRALTDYLDLFQIGADVDLLAIRDSTNQVVAVASSRAADFHAESLPRNGYFRLAEPAAGVVLLRSQTIGSGESPASVTVGRLVDGAYLRGQAAATGLIQTLIVNDRRTATSREQGWRGAVARPAERAEAPSGLNRSVLSFGAEQYYAVVVPLSEEAGGGEIALEVAWPAEPVMLAERTALTLLVSSAAVVGLAASAVGVLLSHHLTRPLRALTQAALQIGGGDLQTPVPVPEGPTEVATLGTALEQSRIHTRQSLVDLERARDWSETLIGSIVEGIVTLDHRKQIASFSQGAERITGWLADEALHRSVGEVFRTPEGTPATDELPGPGGRRLVRLLHRKGRVVTLSMTGARLDAANGSGPYLALVLRDVSEEEAVQDLRSHFLANISHEFRTPLSALNASVELLLEELHSLSRAEIGELLNSIHLSVTGLQTLIDNLLESLSIEAGRFAVRRRPTDLRTVVDDAVRMMRPLLDRREQAPRVQVASNLPKMRIDPMRVTQVLVNLLSNASKYSPVAEPIDIQAEPVGSGLVRVSVSDRGQGIPSRERETLFRRFVRLEQQDPAQYGIGLGLSVVKAIVEEHGGQVGADGRPGGGSIFWFVLPINGAAP